MVISMGIVVVVWISWVFGGWIFVGCAWVVGLWYGWWVFGGWLGLCGGFVGGEIMKVVGNVWVLSMLTIGIVVADSG